MEEPKYSTYSRFISVFTFSKQNEGALYLDNTTSKDDDAVPPGQTYTYTWRVPKTAGPSETDNECITWTYYSHVNPTKDTNSGLVGPLIICRKASEIISMQILHLQIK